MAHCNIILQTTIVSVCIVLSLSAGSRRDRSPTFEDVPYTPEPMRAEEGLPRKPVETEADGLAYLERFGYIGADSQDPRTENIRDQGAVREALRKLQRAAGIPVTGKMDPATRELMSLPRCGVKDADKTRRMKRYAFQGSKWDHSALTYKINSFTNDINKEKTKAILDRAFKTWSEVTPLTFTKRDHGAADIDIEFARGEHGDRNPFDGPGQTLAHAFFPVFGGDAHFDDDEDFTDGQHRGINLFQVAVHEFGHSLGLSHSEDKDALMAPFYRGYQPNFRLHADDIKAIQALYGSKPAPTTPRPTDSSGKPVTHPTTVVISTTTPTLPTGACKGSFDAFATAKTGYRDQLTFAFSGERYFILTRSRVNSRNIKSDFKHLDRVDAAIAISSGYYSNLFLFKGSHVYVYTISTEGRSIRLREKTNGPINSFIRGLPSDIDAIFRWSGNNNIYAFKGREFYRISRNAVDHGYPRSISVWNLPDHISKVDAIGQFNGWTYFFVGQNYYRYMDNKLRVVDKYPKNIGENWLQCTLGSMMALSSTPAAEVESEGKMAAQDGGFIRVKTAIQLENTSGTELSRVNAFLVALSTTVMISLAKLF